MQFSSILLISLVWLAVVASSEEGGSEAEHLLDRTKRQWGFFRALAAAPLAGARLAESSYRGITDGIVDYARGRKRRDTTNDEKTLLDLLSSLDDATNDDDAILDRKKRQWSFLRAAAAAPLAGARLAESTYRGFTDGIYDYARGRKKRDTTNDEETLLDLLSSLDDANNDERILDRKRRQWGFLRAVAAAPLAGARLAESSYRGFTDGIVDYALGRKRRDAPSDEEKVAFLDLASSLNSYLEATRPGRKIELESVLGWVETVVEEAFLAGAIAARDSYRDEKSANYEVKAENGETSQAVKDEVELIAEPQESGQ